MKACLQRLKKYTRLLILWSVGRTITFLQEGSIMLLSSSWTQTSDVNLILTTTIFVFRLSTRISQWETTFKSTMEFSAATSDSRERQTPKRSTCYFPSLALSISPVQGTSKTLKVWSGMASNLGSGLSLPGEITSTMTRKKKLSKYSKISTILKHTTIP